MPLVKRCCICGRLAEPEHNAEPYKRGVACGKCFNKQVIPAIKEHGNYYQRKYAFGKEWNGKRI